MGGDGAAAFRRQLAREGCGRDGGLGPPPTTEGRQIAELGHNVALAGLVSTSSIETCIWKLSACGHSKHHMYRSRSTSPLAKKMAGADPGMAAVQAATCANAFRIRP